MFDSLHTTFFGTFQRMVFWELLRVFLLSLTGLTAMFVIAGVVQQANQFGLSLSQVLTVIPLTVPTRSPPSSTSRSSSRCGRANTSSDLPLAPQSLRSPGSSRSRSVLLRQPAYP